MFLCIAAGAQDCCCPLALQELLDPLLTEENFSCAALSLGSAQAHEALTGLPTRHQSRFKTHHLLRTSLPSILTMIAMGGCNSYSSRGKVYKVLLALL